MDIAACVHRLCPGPEFKGSATIADQADWDSREWVDSRMPKPTWSELVGVLPQVEAAEAAALAAMEDERYIEIYKLKAALKEAQLDGEPLAIAALEAKITLMTGPGLAGPAAIR